MPAHSDFAAITVLQLICGCALHTGTVYVIVHKKHVLCSTVCTVWVHHTLLLSS